MNSMYALLFYKSGTTRSVPATRDSSSAEWEDHRAFLPFFRAFGNGFPRACESPGAGAPYGAWDRSSESGRAGRHRGTQRANAGPGSLRAENPVNVIGFGWC